MPPLFRDPPGAEDVPNTRSEKKGHSLFLQDAPLDVRILTTAPYAGITQVRFKGYDLSRSGTPRLICFLILLSSRMIKQIVNFTRSTDPE